MRKEHRIHFRKFWCRRQLFCCLFHNKRHSKLQSRLERWPVGVEGCNYPLLQYLIYTVRAMIPDHASIPATLSPGGDARSDSYLLKF